MRSPPSHRRRFLHRTTHGCARGWLGVVAMVLLAACATACAPERDCSVVLWWVGDAEQVAAVGDWNGWNPDTHLLEPHGDQDGQPAWRLQLELEPGEYAYQLEVDGEPHNDPFQPLLSWDPATRVETSLLRIADCDQPTMELISAEATATGALSIQAEFLRASGGARLDPASVIARTTDGLAIGGTAWPSSGQIELAQGIQLDI